MSKRVRIKRPKQVDVESKISFEEFESMKCAHCGGAHLRACPRIKKMSFHQSGNLAEIEFWQDGQWDTSNIMWPEQVIGSGESDA
jgi:hypothetical protein